MKSINVTLTLTEEILGTASSNPEIHREFIASKSPDAGTIEDEVAAIGVDAVEQKTQTVFPKLDGKPFFYDYQIKGFFKDACSALARVEGTRSKALKAFRKIIDGNVFVFPRRIVFDGPVKLGNCQRPLRAQTAQGERIALASSETLPAGVTLKFEIRLLDEKLETVVKEWLEYGALRGLGQWRNSGKGRFEWKEN